MPAISKKADVILPCRNEQGTVRKIAETFTAYLGTGRVYVVIDPETTDNSRWEVEPLTDGSSSKVEFVFSGEPGKGQCIKAALPFIETERVVLCDTDLTGFTIDHVHRLIQADGLTIGVPDFPKQATYPFPETRMRMAWPWVSGQRSLPTWVIRPLDLHGYLTEVQINQACARFGITPNLITLHGVTSPLRFNEQRYKEMERDRTWGLKHGILGDPLA